METNGILARMLQRFRTERNGNGKAVGDADAGSSHGALGGVAVEGDPDPVEPGSGAALGVTSLWRPTRRERSELALQKLQEGYEKVVGVVESIQGHLDKQETKTQQLVEAMNALASHVGHLPGETRRQTEALQQMAAMMRDGSERARRVDDHLTKLPQLVEGRRATEARVAETLDGLAGSVTLLGRASEASTAAVQRWHADAAARDEKLAQLFTEQTRRFTIVFSMAITLAVVAAVIGVVALLR